MDMIINPSMFLIVAFVFVITSAKNMWLGVALLGMQFHILTLKQGIK
jgi:hypothetical protein